jgi:hypothetical protein
MSKTTQKLYSLHIGSDYSRCKLKKVVSSDEDKNTVTEWFNKAKELVARNINYNQFWIGAVQ